MFPITSGAQAREINGIGEALAERVGYQVFVDCSGLTAVAGQINEFISGVPGRAFYEDNEHARCIVVFKDIYGVGKLSGFWCGIPANSLQVGSMLMNYTGWVLVP